MSFFNDILFNNALNSSCCVHLSCFVIENFCFYKISWLFCNFWLCVAPQADVQRAHPPRPPASALTQCCFKNGRSFFFQINPDMTKNTDATHKKSLYHPNTDVITVSFHDCTRFRISNRSIRNIRKGGRFELPLLPSIQNK